MAEALHKIPVNIEEEMKRSYLDYAMSVIIGRALPDARDGLKPVHRRILYSMEDLGLRPNKPFKKSATIVGECFVAGTRVLTEKGLVPIEKIERGDWVYTQEGIAPVTELFEMPERELIKITLETGLAVTVTPAQPLKVINQFMQYEWKQADEITPEDHIVVRASYPDKLSYLRLPDWQGRKIMLDENLAYFIGRVLSDGWFERHHGRLCFYSTSRSVIERIRTTLVSLFGYEANVETVRRDSLYKDGTTHKNTAYQARVHSSAINNYLSSVLGITAKSKAHTKRIPEQFFRSPRSVLASLISGMIDGDGSIHISRAMIHYGTVSEGLADDLQLLLQHLGIFATRFVKQVEQNQERAINGRTIHARFPFYSLEIQGRYAKELARMLRLEHEAKSQRLASVVEASLKASKYDRVPRASAIVFGELSRCHLGGGWYRDTQGQKFRMGIKYPTGNKIRYSSGLSALPLNRKQLANWGISDKLARMGSHLAPFVSNLLENDIHFIRVARVEAAPAQKTYDLEVAEMHEFVANGIVSHNCLGKYHPHGDSAVYDALVRMAQDFSMRNPLVEGQGNFGCFTGDTKIKLLDSTDRTFAELAELPQGEIFYVYSVTDDGRIVVGEGRDSRITRRKAQLVELIFDDGSKVRCTPDHKFMLRDGTWKEAQLLSIEDSLMAGYFDTSPINERTNDYLRVRQPLTSKYEFVHCLADEYNERKGFIPKTAGPYVRHHKNLNRFDNTPSNIERMGWLEHLHLHAELITELWELPEFREAQRIGVQNYYANNPEVIEARRQRMIAQNKSETFRKENGLRIARALRERHARQPELANKQSEFMRQLWQDPDYRAKMSQALSGIEKRPLTSEQKERVAKIISEKSREMWKDPEKRNEITSAIIRALSEPAIRNRISENSRRLWQDPDYRAKYSPDHHSRMAKKLWDDPTTRELHRAKILDQWQDPEFRAAHLKGRRHEYAARIEKNPGAMAELAERAAAVLREKWQNPDYTRQVMRMKIAGYVSRLVAEFGREKITPDLYNTQRNANWIPNIKKALAYFDSFDELLDVASSHNHRVVDIRWLDEPADVYDITVNEYHNFMLANGCIVHNSVDGDSAAAYRYTEARLTRIATEMLADIDKDTVDFVPNYDESRMEPVVLPTRFPNLLVNGSSGIAVGMATNIPPHNLSEIIDATVHLIQNPTANLKTLMAKLPGPDFPTGGFIYGREGINQAYRTGRGSIVMRARATIDRAGRAGERMAILVTEIPFQVNKAKLIERIADLINDKKLEGIHDLRDESDREGMRIMIELKRDAIPDIVLNNLYKMTPMQQSFGVINLAIVNGQPRELPLIDTLNIFIEHRREVVTRRSRFDLNKAEARAHILEGLKKALDNLDAVIAVIRKSKGTQEAREGLMFRFKFTEAQARAILEMQLQRLTGLERQKLIDEYKDIIQRIAELQEILSNESALRGVIIKELREVQRAYGDERRTEIIEAGAELTLEDLIADEDMAITVTHSGYIKRTPVSVYRAQRRGGTGRRGAALKTEDVVDHLFVASTHSYIMIFTNNGQVYKLKVHEVPDAGAAGKGKAIVNLLNMPKGEKVAGIIPVREFEEGKYVVLATRKGTIKKTELSDFANIRPKGINAMGINDGDELIAVELTDGEQKIFLATNLGMAICFEESDVRSMGRPAYGVRGISLRKGDYVISVAAVSGDVEMLSMSENGFGKRTRLDAYRVQSRGGRGVINMKTSERNGKVVAVLPVNDESQVLIITTQGKLIRVRAKGIRESGRSTQGVKLIDASDGDFISSASLIEREQDATVAPENEQ